MKKRIILIIVLSPVALLFLGIFAFLTASYFIQTDPDFSAVELPVGSKIYDTKNRLIGELSVQNRIPIKYDDLPVHLISALLLREDKDFFSHGGFSISGFGRALLNNISGKKIQGGSTISQQLATMLFSDKTDKSITRKIVELWWAFQLEKKYTKEEILELYLNNVYFGSGCYGIESACRYFFGHGVKDVTQAESAMVVIQIVRPDLYNPFKAPDRARTMQEYLLNKMADAETVPKKQIPQLLEEYWRNVEWNRTSVNTSFLKASQEHPHVFEYIRREIDQCLSGKYDYYRDGLSVYTSIDLDAVRTCEEELAKGIKAVDKNYSKIKKDQNIYTASTILDMINLLSLQFPIAPAELISPSERYLAQNEYVKKIHPLLSMLDLFTPVSGMDELLDKAEKNVLAYSVQNDITGAAIVLDNSSGAIIALADGTDYSKSEFIRAIQGSLMPGSAMKPLYYSAALDMGKFTTASLIPNQAIALVMDDNKEYRPKNYFGYYSDIESFRNALIFSYNIPSVRVLDTIGIETGRIRASVLLDLSPEETEDSLSKDFSFALGSSVTSPLKLAQAYSVFANGGIRKTPYVIEKILDTKGQSVYEHEKREIRVISAANAFIMNDLLKDVVNRGTLRNSFSTLGGKSGQIYAGKTGTTQNWGDAWATGYSNLFTSVVWIGFDRPGNSLGTAQTGAGSSGPVWAGIMKKIHEGHTTTDFPKPSSVVKTKVCHKSGLLAVDGCGTDSYDEYFLADFLPNGYCDIHVKKPVEPKLVTTQEPTMNIPKNGVSEADQPNPGSTIIIEHGQEDQD